MKLAQLKGLVDTFEQFRIINELNPRYHHLCSENNNNFVLHTDIDQHFGGERFHIFQNKIPNGQKVTHEFLKDLSETLGVDSRNDGFSLSEIPILFTTETVTFPGDPVFNKPKKTKIHEISIDRNNEKQVDIIYGHGRLSYFNMKYHCLDGMYYGLRGMKFFILDEFIEIVRISNTQEINNSDIPNFENLSNRQVKGIMQNLHDFQKMYKDLKTPEWFQNFEIMR